MQKEVSFRRKCEEKLNWQLKELQLESNGKEKHLYAMKRAERSKFSQKMSKKTTLTINHATRVAIRKSSLKKFALLILTLITRHTIITLSNHVCQMDIKPHSYRTYTQKG